MADFVMPYSVCDKCGVGRMSPEPQHRPKDAHLAFPGQAMLHCYNFGLHIVGCGNAVPAPAPALVAAANKAETDAKLAAEAEAHARALESSALIAKTEAERLRAHHVGSYTLLTAKEVASMSPMEAASLQSRRLEWDAAHPDGPHPTDLLSADEQARLTPQEQRALIHARREWDKAHVNEVPTDGQFGMNPLAYDTRRNS